jgi:aryl-alcohol dehydrogenase
MPHYSNTQLYEIRAAVLREQGRPLRIETLELEGPRDDEVLVRIVATGICHTDIDICNDWDGSATPAVLGHEGAGVVEEVGKGVKSVERGDHVGGCPEFCVNGVFI